MRNADSPAMPSGSVVKRRINQNDPGSDFYVMSHTSPLSPGLSKREHIAAMAMQGLTSSAFRYMAEGGGHATKEAMDMMKDIGVVSCDIADALLAELEKEGKS